ncbi:MAG: hypothetical protein K9G57_14850 [Ignavibacteriales bacterium]|nr:hypothetical protein [Ignavibacteriales bacterium]MCF8438128.1 hypothetical protein [Ignavibacteriales bacterium]
MYRLSFLIILFLSNGIFGQSPHGSNFDIDCLVCHTTDNWKIDRSKLSYDHSTTGFELLGQHKAADCKSCHNTLVFSSSDSRCISCHKDVHENSTGFDCERCHTPESWVVSSITEIHQLGRFPLLGSHAVADCESCHSSSSKLNFVPLGVQCFDCHTEDYNSTQNPNHILSGFSKDCESCHTLTSNSWSGTGFDHNFFPLTGGHSIATCASCHTSNLFTGLSNQCVSCHLQDFQATVNPSHSQNNFSQDCQTCHTTSPGWQPAQFPGHNNIYPIIGAHTAIASQCQSCHSAGYTNTPNQCVGCHQDEYNSTVDPPHQTLAFDTDCTQCHNQNAWSPADFDHDGPYFPIYSGKHRGEWDNCSDCHINSSNYQDFSCINCHEHSNKSEVDSDHQGVNGYQYNSQACYTCHPSGEGDDGPNHANTGFPLTGQHQSVSCADCHQTGYQNTPTDCYSCHLNNYQSAPNHLPQGYPTDCVICHDTQTWQASTFNHSATNFPLTGSHNAANCSDCHSAGFAGTSAQCSDCHQTDYNSAQNPNHITINTGTDCARCHQTGPGWQPAQYPDHNNVFALTNSHSLITVSCSDCHSTGYSNTNSDCYSCHTIEYNNSTNPAHLSAGFPTTCEDCHSPTQWNQANFDHDGPYFPIYSGKHNGEWASCADCHTQASNFSAFDCTQCHEHNKIEMDQKHRSITGYIYSSPECFACHPDGSDQGAFDHQTSAFPLTGAHSPLDCSQCHTNGYSALPTECLSCHDQNYNNAPNHLGQNYPTNCDICHVSEQWADIVYDHGQTNFLLTGGHTNTDCQSCHTGGLAGTSTACTDCHSDDYQQAINPNHTALNLGDDCSTCHTTSIGWEPAEFPQHNQYYLITGAHTQISNDCSQCHSGDYVNTPDQCYGCHSDDYQSVSNPPHNLPSFSQDCTECHNQTAWTPSTFEHDAAFFPIYSGKHQGEWNICSDCHTISSNYSVFECINCHEHGQAQMASEHQGVQGYQFSSTACLACHPDGSEGSSFNHANSAFPLTGAHLETECSVCHISGYNPLPVDCISCHEQKYLNSVNPNHQTAGISNVCQDCHNTTAWIPGTFNHSATGFQLAGAHITNQCSDCHTGSTSGTSTLCADCHLSDFNNSLNPNHTVIGISDQCQDCHNTIAWVPGTFDHNSTNFQLLGGHTSANCSDCHQGITSGTSSVCVDCHLSNFNNSLNPNHTAIGLSDQCQDCHNTIAWVPGSFDHNSTNFQLLGGHTSATCSDCHQGVTSGTSSVCVDCHLSVYNTAPDHVTQNFPTDCQLCHSATAWNEVTFDHANTNFPLTGVHLTTQCSDCHAVGYTGTSSVCSECHLSDFQASANPDHEILNIPQNCDQCHTTNANWEPASFPIHNNYFALIGAHNLISDQCVSCHNGNYNNTANTCVGCHQQDYNSVSNPNHLSQGFPLDCEECHSQSAWIPSTFNHDQQYFPIYSGKHDDEWNLCSDCHTVAGNFSIFSCIDCHEHRQSEMDNEHEGVQGYIYNSIACYDCHPDGSDKSASHLKLIDK